MFRVYKMRKFEIIIKPTFPTVMCNLKEIYNNKLWSLIFGWGMFWLVRSYHVTTGFFCLAVFGHCRVCCHQKLWERGLQLENKHWTGLAEVVTLITKKVPPLSHSTLGVGWMMGKCCWRWPNFEPLVREINSVWHGRPRKTIVDQIWRLLLWSDQSDIVSLNPSTP